MRRELLELEGRMEESGLFEGMAINNVGDKLEAFLRWDCTIYGQKQAGKDADLLLKITEEAEQKRRLEELEARRIDDSLFLAIGRFLESDTTTRDADLMRIVRILNRLKDKRDSEKAKIAERRKK